MKRQHLVIGTLAATLALASHAQQPGVDARLEKLEQELRLLKQQQQTDKSAAILSAGKDGFGLKSADGNFQLKLRGQLQLDQRFYLDDDQQKLTDTFLLRRLRPILEGTLYKNFDFRLMPDFGGGSAVLQDAYVEWTYWPTAKVRAGKFKAPVGLERLQPDSEQWFIENGFPSSLVPARDIGMQLGGDWLAGRLSYAVGVFNGVADGANADFETTGESKELAARVFAHPFKQSSVEALRGLGLGVGGSFGDQTGTTFPSLPSFKTAGQQTFFSYVSSTNAPGATYADGRHYRVSPQAYYYWGPFGLLGEYAISNQEIARGTGHTAAHNTAWQIAGSVLLTDDDASFRGVNPHHPFDPKNGGWGAWELIARVGQLDVDNDLFPTYADPSKSASKATAWGVGLNWYLNRNVRLWLDYERTTFHGGAGTSSAVKDRATEDALFTRVQLLF